MFNLVNAVDFRELKVNFKTGERRGKKKKTNILPQFNLSEFFLIENLVNCLVIVFDRVDARKPISGHIFANSVMTETEIYIHS